MESLRLCYRIFNRGFMRQYQRDAIFKISIFYYSSSGGTLMEFELPALPHVPISKYPGSDPVPYHYVCLSTRVCSYNHITYSVRGTVQFS